jgi:dihydroxyacid dehydratase/phosphogluconate dehydratase
MTNARVFTSTSEAVDYCRAEKLKGMELVVIRGTQPPLFVPVG